VVSTLVVSTTAYWLITDNSVGTIFHRSYSQSKQQLALGIRPDVAFSRS
jgi:hypothetical protein